MPKVHTPIIVDLGEMTARSRTEVLGSPAA
jgi:hypothetical protein